MNWLQKTSWSPKHEKDKKNIYLWHVSPDRHNVLKSRSRMGKEDYSYQGLYFTPSFKSLLKDWMSYVAAKKNSNDNYKSLYIHKVLVPEWVLKESYKRQNNAFDTENQRGEASLGFWGWGQQVFIPEDLLDEVSVIDIKKYDYNELRDLCGEYYKNRDKIIDKFNDPEWWFHNPGTTREDIIQQRKDDAKRRSQITVQNEMRKRKEKERLKEEKER